MENLFLINETITNGYTSNILNIIFFTAVLSSVLVIISKNPIVSLLFLISLFGSISCYLIMLGLGFVGLSYLIVYIGAVSILFLFILMLINIRISELQNNTYNTVPLVVIITIFLSYALFNQLPYDITANNNYLNKTLGISTNNPRLYDYFNRSNLDSNDLFYVSSNVWDGNLVESDHIVSIGSILYTNYSVWLLIVGIILLLAMVGCIVITLKPKDQ